MTGNHEEMKKVNSDKLYRVTDLFLELTNVCNFKCDFCPTDRLSRKRRFMPTDLACNIIDQIADNHLTKYLYFHVMGEPFLHRDLSYLVGYAESRGVKVVLLTNGSLLEKKRNRELFENNLTRLEVSFRTPNEKSFGLRVVGGKWLTMKEYIGKVERLITDKIETEATTEICVKLFIRSYAATLKLANSYQHLTDVKDNLDVVRRLQAHTLKVAKDSGRDIEGWKIRSLRLAEGEYPIFPGILIGFGRIQHFWVRRQRGESETVYRALLGGCSHGFQDSFAILANGEVTTCCVDYDGENVVGDLREESLMEVLGSEEATGIRRSFQWLVPPTSFCRQCLGGPTVISSLMKQVGSVVFDIQNRILKNRER